MPCRDERDDFPQYEKVNELETILREVRKELNHYKAMMCALTSEIFLHPDGLKIINDAEINGKVDISTFIKDHSEEDKDRLKESMLKSYSNHEINLISQMIKNNELCQ